MKRTAYIIGDRKKFGADRDFEKAERHLENFFFEVFNPKKHHSEVLRAADFNEEEAAEIFMQYMKNCDIVFVLKTYTLSAEAHREFRVAELLGMPMSFQVWE